MDGRIKDQVYQWSIPYGLFLNEQYQIFNNVIIRTERGSTQINHIIVSKGSIFNGKFKNYIQSKNIALLSPDEIGSIRSDLTWAKASAGFLGGWRHSKELKNRYSSATTCPKCEGGDVNIVG
ncbi:MAG: NERD domain-containing protein [Deltaproteobacteria bacterium]|nr:NERD domain-containing protein [Deltaproteobacteria bacterium]